MRLGMGLFAHFSDTQTFSKITCCQLIQKNRRSKSSRRSRTSPFFGDLSRPRLSSDIATSQGCFVSPKWPQTKKTSTGVVFRPSISVIIYRSQLQWKYVDYGVAHTPPHYPNLPILSASPIASSKRLRYICVRKLKVTHSSFIKLAERGLDGLTPLIKVAIGVSKTF